VLVLQGHAALFGGEADPLELSVSRKGGTSVDALVALEQAPRSLGREHEKKKK